ncbi:MAG TPA: hypothetical protein PK106_04985 [Bacteroidales bacterium]|nr:hypothetical protein [Bacteroidales bacterium]
MTINRIKNWLTVSILLTERAGHGDIPPRGNEKIMCMNRVLIAYTMKHRRIIVTIRTNQYSFVTNSLNIKNSPTNSPEGGMASIENNPIKSTSAPAG